MNITLKELHEQHPWKSINKFMPYALNKGFTEAEVKKYFKNNVLKDKLNIDASEYYLPIYGKEHGCYQFDTLIQSHKAEVPAFLIFININSRKAYAYPMLNKGKSEVLKAMQKFVDEVECKQLTSDQDSAYLNKDIIDYMISKHITYKTTEDNNHNILGIINRFIKTLRDLNKERDFTNDSMNKCVNEYNNTIHSATGIAPNKFSNSDEDQYISEMEELTDMIASQKSFSLKHGDKVRVILDKPTIGKKRSNLSNECYIVDSRNGYGYNIVAKDSSTAFYPRHKLVLTTKGEVANTINNDKRGIIDKILDYNAKSDKYKVVYEGGVTDEIKSKNLRETNPTHLSDIERDYWKNKSMPENLRKFL